MRTTIRRFFRVAFFCALLVASVSRAQLASDVSVGAIPGGNVLDLAFDPSDAGTIYAASSGSGLFKSNDRGASWNQVFLPTVTSHNVLQVLPSTRTPNLVFLADALAGVESTVLRSTDGATTFTGVIARMNGRATRVTESSTTAGTVYASLTDDFNPIARLWKSTDSGLTWTMSATIQPGVDVVDLLHVPMGGGRLLAGTRATSSGSFSVTGKLLVSSDDGATWVDGTGTTTSNQATTGFAWNGNAAAPMIFARRTDNNLTTLWSSTDGQSWTLVRTYGSPGMGNDFANSPIRYHPLSDTFFVLTTEDKLIQSGTGPSYPFAAPGVDLFATQGNLNLTRNVCFAIDPTSGPATSALKIVAGENGGEGILLSANGGGSWALANTGFDAQELNYATKSISSGIRYAASGRGFIYASATSLGSWTRIYRAANQFSFDLPQALTFDVADPTRLFVAFGNPNDAAGSASFKVVRRDSAPSAPEDVSPYAHTGWVSLGNPGTPTQIVAALLANGTTVWAGITPRNNSAEGNYLFKNTGAGWTQVSSLTTLGGVRALAFGGSTSSTIYAGAGDYEVLPGYFPFPKNANGIFKSTDNGATWTRLASNVELNAMSPRKIVVDRNDENRVWAHVDHVGPLMELGDNAVFESVNGGTTWTRITAPTRGGVAMTYVAAEDALVLASGNGVIFQKPGSGSTEWAKGPDFYGDIRALYEGSLGAATGQGLFEVAALGSPNISTDGGPGPGGKRGCGCSPGAGGDPAVFFALVSLLGVAGRARRRSRID